MIEHGDDGVDDDDLDPEEAERRIAAFIEAAAGLPGPPVEELADAVGAQMAVAWADLKARLDGIPPDKVLATMLLVGQRARGAPADRAEAWQLHAASSLLSGFVGRSAT